MKSDIPPKYSAVTTPRLRLAFAQLGTGIDLKKAQYANFLRENGAEVVAETRSKIQELSGLSPTELYDLAPKYATSTSPKAVRARRKILTHMMDTLPFLQKYKKTERESGLREVGIMANDYVNEVVGEYLAREEQARMNNEVENCNDPSALLLMAFYDELAAKVKFEAARKLLLMEFLGEIRDYSEKEVDHQEALQYMFSFFNEKIFHLPEGERIGTTFKRYLVSAHEEDSYRTSEATILKDAPEKDGLSEMHRVTSMHMRQTLVQDESGNERAIFFSIEPREKTTNSRLTKALRYNSMIGEKDVDRNGIRMVFETREDWEDFFRMFKDGLETQIARNLRERLEDEESKEAQAIIESRLRQENVIITEVKDSLDGNGFKGNAPSSSESLRVFKFKLKVFRADSRLHDYEFQIFLPDGYADAIYRKGVSWEEYNVDRFFREGVDELLFPSRIYDEIDREAIRESMMKQAHRGIWNGKVM